MGLFSFFKKKEDNELIDRMKEFSTQALKSSSLDIQQHGTFFFFFAVLTNEGILQLIVYHNPEAESFDIREHATAVQKIIEKRYHEPNCDLCYMAFDGISHLPTGDIDSINVRVSHKPSNTHKMFSYPYNSEDGQIQILNDGNPLINNI